jgi:hypothetical protein
VRAGSGSPPSSPQPTGAFCYGFYSFDPTKGGYDRSNPAGAQHQAEQSAILASYGGKLCRAGLS